MIALPQLVAVVVATSDSALSLGRNQDLLNPQLAMLPNSTARALLGTVQNSDPARFVGSFESIAFIGVVGAVLAVIGITDAVMKPQRRPWAISFVVIGVLAVVWAMGPRTFVFDTAFDVLPGFDLARASARWLVVFTIVASLFVGVGVDVLTRRVRPVHLVAAVVATLAVAGALAIGLVDAAGRTMALWALTAAAAIGLVVVIMAAPPRTRWAVAAIGAVLAIGAIEMTAMSLHSMPMSKTTDTPFTDHPSTTTDYLRDHPGGSTIALTDEELGPAYEVPGMRPNANVLPGIPSIDGYDGGVQITKRWAKSLAALHPRPPDRAAVAQQPACARDARVDEPPGCALRPARQRPRPGRVHPRLGRPARRRREHQRLGEPDVDRRCGGVADGHSRRGRRRGRPAAHGPRSIRGDRDRRPSRRHPGVHRSDRRRLRASRARGRPPDARSTSSSMPTWRPTAW